MDIMSININKYTMKKILISVLASVLLITGCSSTKTVSNLELESFTFEMPTDWTLISQTENSAEIAIPSVEQFELVLEMQLNKLYSNSLPVEGTDEVITTADNIQLYNLGCGGALYCGNIAYNQTAYAYQFTVTSTEPAPENIDSIWIPQVSITQDDLKNFISTVKLR
jgi:hypothetical protein